MTPRQSRPCSSPPPVCRRARSRSWARWDNSRPRRARPPRRCTIPVARSPQSRCTHRGRPSWSTTFGRSNRCSAASCRRLALLGITHEINPHVRSSSASPEARALSWSREAGFSGGVISRAIDRTARCDCTVRDRNQLTLAFLGRTLRWEFTIAKAYPRPFSAYGSLLSTISWRSTLGVCFINELCEQTNRKGRPLICRWLYRARPSQRDMILA